MPTDPRPKIFVIVGPTASGKSALAVRLARQLRDARGTKPGGEVISADSRQVYRGLDIGTGKITRAEMRGVRHHLLDVADPRRRFTVEQYQKLAGAAIRDIVSRGKVPIICGGSGFYVDAIVNGTRFPAVGADLKLRKRLSKKTASQLFSMLEKLDRKKARGMNESDRKNPRRLIRAIEIARGGNSRPAPMKKDMGLMEKYDVRYIGISVPQAELKKKIRARIASRMKIGMVAEARRLREPRTKTNPDGGLSWKRMDELGLEYRYLAQHLQGEMTREEFIEKLATESGRYAKRQMTWWRRDKKIQWTNKKTAVRLPL